MGATETIAQWVVNTSYENIPRDAIRVANESCFDLPGVTSVECGGVLCPAETADRFPGRKGGRTLFLTWE